MSGTGTSKLSTCFICSLSMEEGEIVLVKEKGVQTVRASSVALKNVENERLLKHLNQIHVHTACQKRYNNQKLMKAAVQRGETHMKKTSTRASSPHFSFKDHCFMCGEIITAKFIENQKKYPAEKRNSVHTVEKVTMNANILEAAERRGDEWALKIKQKISEDTDLVALDARYHLFCQRMLYKSPSKGLGRGSNNAYSSSVDKAMDKIFTYLEGNSDECQFSLNQLIEQIEGEKPDIRTIKKRLFEKYGDDVLVVDPANTSSVFCFKHTGYKIITQS